MPPKQLQCGFFGTPRGPGLATATTSAASFPHLEHRVQTLDPSFVLNDPAYRGSQILLTGENFGCGSSREHAVWALAEYGFRALIAPSFNPIFYRNCLRNAVLPARLALPEIRVIAAWVSEGPQCNRLTVNLSTRQIAGAGKTWMFEIGDDAREALLEGLDEIDQTLKMSDAIAHFAPPTDSNGLGHTTSIDLRQHRRASHTVDRARPAR